MGPANNIKTTLFSSLILDIQKAIDKQHISRLMLLEVYSEKIEDL